jgi:hypothetical protein
MKILHYYKSLFLLVFIIPLFIGCSDNLNRSKAEKIIKEKFQLPNDEIRDLYVYDATLSNNFTLNLYQKLQNEGLLTFSECGEGMSRGYCATLTEKGKQYAVSQEYNTDNMYIHKINVKVSTLDFGEITGIMEQKELNIAEVNYTIVRKDVNPFGRIAFDLNNGTFTKSVTFTKYDDGWRISE